MNAPGGPHGSPLLAACHQANEKVGLCLIQAGAKIETPDLMGRTALHRCLRANQTAASNCLLNSGASAAMEDYQRCSALHHAACTGFVAGVERLLEVGAPLGTKDSAGWTPLHWAARNGSIQIVEMLIIAGADKTTADMQGRTPLETAITFENDHLRSLLWHSKVPELIHGVGSTLNCNACEMVRLSLFPLL